MFKKTTISAAVALGILAATPAMAELSANIGAASNYIWRGTTQTEDGAAVSGGLDYTSGGFYLGTWASNVSWTAVDGYELDLYGGYAAEAGAVSWDVGLIAYLYPIGDGEDDFTEIYVKGGYGPVSGGIYYTVDTEAGGDDANLYVNVGADFEISEGMGFGIYVGNYDFDGGSDGDYTHFGAALSKGDFTFAFDQTDQDDAAGDPRITVSWGTSF